MRIKLTSALFPAIAAIACLAGSSAKAEEISIGDILVCYSCNGTNTDPTGVAAIDAAVTANPGLSDGILFDFANTSAFAITGGTFSVGGPGTSPADTFALPTIAAGSSFILIPGITSDGNSHPAGGLFAVTGNVQDTSDGAGGLTDASIFEFTGTSDALSVMSLTVGSSTAISGTFTPGDPGLDLPYRDNPTGTSESFIGDGPSGDGGCDNCYFGEVATLDLPASTAAPEPASMALLLLSGLVTIGWARRRFAR